MIVSKKIREHIEPYLDGHDFSLFNLFYLLLFNAGCQLNLLFRISHRLSNKFNDKRFFWLIPRIVVCFERIIFGSYINPGAKIGKRFKIIYGMGIVIGGKVKIGDDVTIFNGVSLGSATPGLPDVKQPKIGNNVFIGTGAKVLGDITIGDNVKIGANSVVLKSFGPNVTIAGVPAKIMNNNQHRKDLR